MAQENPLVSLAGIIAGTSVAIVAITVLFSNADWIAAPIVVALASLGFGLGWLQTRSETKAQRKR